MRRGAISRIAGLVGLALSSGPEAAAQDASFGCKVLLCAAATSPGWSAIPYCVPVMQQLFRQLARGRGWPACPEGRTSGVGYEPYQACPVGMTPARRNENSAIAADAGGDLCVELSKPRQTCASGDGGCVVEYPTMSRATRAEPYFVDITTASGAQRFFFSLRNY